MKTSTKNMYQTIVHGLTLFIPALILGFIVRKSPLKKYYLIRRDIAYLIDITLLIAIFGATVAEVMVCGLLCYNPYDSFTTRFYTYSVLFIITSYFGITEAIFGRTLGKKILGLKVVSKVNGEKPKITAIFIRTITRFLVIFDLIPSLFAVHETLHDKFSKTRVV